MLLACDVLGGTVSCLSSLCVCASNCLHSEGGERLVAMACSVIFNRAANKLNAFCWLVLSTHIDGMFASLRGDGKSTSQDYDQIPAMLVLSRYQCF